MRGTKGLEKGVRNDDFDEGGEGRNRPHEQ